MGVATGRSLLELWNTNANAEVGKKQREFLGRLRAGGPIAKLYVQLEKEHE